MAAYDQVMIRGTFIAVLVWASMEGSAAWAQENDWAAVMNLRPGTTIGIINLGGAGQPSLHQVCRLLTTTAEGIECAMVRADGEWMQEFARDQISEIHFESVRVGRTYRRILIGALIGGGLARGRGCGGIWRGRSV